MAPLTAVEGAEMRANTDLAVAQINASGGIHGHPLQVVYADPQAQPTEAGTLAQQLIVGEYVADDPHFAGLLRGQQLTGPEQLQGPCGADQPR